MSKMWEGATFQVQLMCSYRLEEMLTKEQMLPLPGLCDKKKTVDRAVLGQRGKVSNTIISQPRRLWFTANINIARTRA